MVEKFEPGSTDPAVAAARQAIRAPQRRRFYKTAKAVAAGTEFSIELDGKLVHTPARQLVKAPTLALAELLAAEWDAQRDVIDPAAMPLTRLTNSIIDGVTDQTQQVAAEIENYLASDLLFYRADGPRGLVARQAAAWDPILAWAAEALGARFRLAEGIVHVTQPATALTAAAAAIPTDRWRLGALHSAMTLTGSALIALALMRGVISAEDAWAAAHVDEDWNIDQWGRDEIAMARREFRRAEFLAAATVLAALRG